VLTEGVNGLGSQQALGGEIRVLPYSPKHKPQIVELLNVSLQRKLVGERDAAYWDWKHEQNPFGTSLLLLAECDDKLVGLRAFMRWRLQVQGRTIHAAKPVDSVTHPDYQRRGIFTRLTQQACELSRREGIQFLFNTPNDNSKPGYLKLGWQQVDALPLYVKPLRPLSTGWRLAGWKCGRKRIPEQQEFFREEPIMAASMFGDAKAISQIIASLNDNRLGTARSADFLRWRYCQHPHICYYVECVEGNSGLDGMLVYRTNFRQGLREIMIDDILAANDRREIVAELMRKLRSRVAAEYVLGHFSLNSAPGSHLRSLGFWKLPRRRISLVARVLNEPVTPDPLLASSWSLCMGDLEGL
jgi:GNAT superfamily N-acetyltransferase